MNSPLIYFERGCQAFNARDFYAAHEYWETLWSEYKLADEVFIQGLIQLAVAYFHLTNDNLKGATSLFNKCLPKLEGVAPQDRELDVRQLVAAARKSRDFCSAIAKAGDFDWSLVPHLQVSSEQ